MFVPFWMSWGAVVASLITYLVAVVFIFRKSQQVYRVPVTWKKMVLMSVGTLLSLIVVVYIQQVPLADEWVLIGWGIFCVTLFVSRIDRDLRRPLRTNEEENEQTT